MKRTIAIILAVLVLTVCLTGCNRKNGGNVSDTTNGTVSNPTDRADHQDNANKSSAANNTQSGSKNSYNDREKQDSGFMDDMERAVDDAGQAIGDVGRAVGDAVTGNNAAPGTGMTGGR